MKQKVIQCGLGPIGQEVSKILLANPKVELMGAFDISDTLIGKSVHDLLSVKGPSPVITKTIDDIPNANEADTIIFTTTSNLTLFSDQIIPFIKKGYNILSTCEELSYPWIVNSTLSSELDALAKENNCSILGTGVNPGFLMDYLPLINTSFCTNVSGIRVRRIQNASIRRLPFKRKIGAGLTVSAFENLVKEKKIRHVGLTESAHFLADRLHIPFDHVEDKVSPVIAQAPYHDTDISVKTGDVLGVYQTGTASYKGNVVIELIFKASLGETQPIDAIDIIGTPNVSHQFTTPIHGDTATAAITANCIPVIKKAPAGLLTMADVPTVSCFQ